ncbi:cytochrome b [Benzoatithermus flavus]|uniref:Cytochrome b/b6 domain-containing protein n=1 Tax=Benzoatithermus flavus TaxID=3108223 RepID=A0ABU8XXW0_9PROT
MALLDTTAEWGWPTKLLHWVTALAVIGMLGLGFSMVWLVADLGARFRLYQLHKSTGLLVLVLALVRLVWRSLNPVVPELPATMPAWERTAARLTHRGLYAFLLLLPLTGWLMTAVSPLGVPTVVFGLLTLPDPLPPDGRLEGVLQVAHALLAVLLVLLLVLHVGGALRHHLVRRDDVLRRMLPRLRRRSPAAPEVSR